MPRLESALDFARRHEQDLIDRCVELLAIPSISTLPEHRGDVARAAQWLVDELHRIGIERADVMETPGLPLVYAQTAQVSDRPTVLVYGHFDVQPTDPIKEWDSDPFDATLRGEELFARGSSDMKCSLLAFLQAVEAFQDDGDLPVNLKFLLEGEEEVGSPSLPEFIRQHRDLLRADVAVNCDGETHAPTQPSICYALRGLAYFEIEVHGAKQDLHSGVFGGSLHNPAQALCELLAGMHDEDGRVTLPGFYDTVRPLDDDERAALARVPLVDEEWRAMAGVPALWGETGYTLVERLGARPTLEVNGLVSGFTGEGAKTVLPAKALAKVSMRLVADQEPDAIEGQLRAYVEEHAPETVTWEIRNLGCAPGAITARDSREMRAAQRALHDSFGAEPFFKREGGSVPVVGIMQQELGVDSIIIGFRLPDSNMHGPNEKQHVPTLCKGVEALIRLMLNLADPELT